MRPIGLVRVLGRRYSRSLGVAAFAGMSERRRTTTMLCVSQADAVGQWTGGPAIGALGTVTSIRVALVGATACLLPAFGFLRRASRLHVAAPPAEAVVTTAD